MLNIAQKTSIVKMQSSAGQALIELAVFGGIFLIVLSVLVRYGIEFNLQQKAEMTAHRRALALASTTISDAGSPAVPLGSAGYDLNRQALIPDVTEPMGQGTVSATGASASVTRNPIAHLTSGTPTPHVSDAQSYLRINSNGAEKDFRRKKTYGSGFRIETSVSERSIPKYEEFYNILVQGSSGDWKFWNADEEDKEGTYRTTCLNFVMVPNPAYDACINGYGSEGGSYGEGSEGSEEDDPCEDIPAMIPDCTEYGLNLRIDDPCIATAPDYETCYEQARVTVDEDYCKLKCTKTNNCSYLSGSARTNCTNKCNNLCILRTNPPNQDDSTYSPTLGGAWYAAGYTFVNYTSLHDGAQRVYTFPRLDDFFDVTPLKKFGTITGGVTTTDSYQTQAFDKQETPSRIVTREAAAWNETVSGNIFYQNSLDEYGYQEQDRTAEYYANNVVSTPVVSEVSVRLNQTWQTDK